MNFTGAEIDATRQPNINNNECTFNLEDVATFDTETIAIQIINIVLNVPTSVMAVAGNLLVFISVWRTSSLHSPSHVLLCSLALSDMNVGLLVQPLFVTFSVAKILRFQKLFCYSAFLLSVVGSILGMVSLFTLTAISLDRSLAIHLHLRYGETVTVKRVIALIVSIWLLCMCVGLTMFRQGASILSVFYPAVVFFCLVFTSVAYYKIYKVARRHQAQINAQALSHITNAWQNESGNLNMTQVKKSSINMFLVSCLLLFFYLPFLCSAAVMAMQGINGCTSSAQEITWTFMLINSSLNPFVYFWRLREIRAAVLKTLQRSCGGPARTSNGSSAQN